MTLETLTTPEILQVSHNSLNRTYTSCARKFEFRKLFNASYFSESLPGDAGNALHKMWQDFLVYGDKDRAVWQLMKHYPIKFQKSAFMNRSLQACYATGLAMMESTHLAQYELANVNRAVRINDTVQQQITAAIEVPFAINIQTANGTPFILTAPDGRVLHVVYVGYIDVILYDAFSDTYIVCDVKTTTKWRQDYTATFQFDPQCLPYALVLERILGRPFDTLTVKYLVCYIDILQPRVLMYEFPKTKQDVLEWARMLAKQLREIRMYMQMDWFPRNGLACDGYGICPHANYCHERDRRTIEQYLELDAANNGIERPPFEPWFELNLQVKGL
jgi:hypothetical protein